jgi:plasmid maintenance system antidote protein VapI
MLAVHYDKRKGDLTDLSRAHDDGGCTLRSMRRSEARQLVGAYVADRLGRECSAHGARAEIARAIKFSRGHISAVINGASGVGEDFADRIASYWGMTYDELEATAERWAAKNGVTIEPAEATAPASWRRLRERDEWGAEVADARTRYPTVPAQFFDAVGQLFDTLPHRLDAQFIGEMARAMHDAAAREGVGPESSTRNNHPPGHTRRAKH